MSLVVNFKASTNVPVEVEGIVPDVTCEMSLDEIRAIEVFHGNEKVSFGEFFDIEGDPSDRQIDCHGR